MALCSPSVQWEILLQLCEVYNYLSRLSHNIQNLLMLSPPSHLQSCGQAERHIPLHKIWCSLGDTTMSASRMVTNGRLLLLLIMDSLNPQSYSLTFAIPLPHPSDSWMTHSTIWLLKDSLSSTWMASSSPPPTKKCILNTLITSSNGWPS